MLRLLTSFVVGIIVGAGVLWLYQNAPVTYSGTAKVIDGDNIRIDGRNIRLVAINAPELPKGCRVYRSRPECHDRSSDTLHERVGGKQVSCLRVGRDRFGRVLGVCHHDGVELNMWLIENCLAGSPRRKKHRQDRYERAIAARNCRAR
jgi:endonuclease YncB( thermonuclease family)